MVAVPRSTQTGRGETFWFLDSKMTVKATGHDTHGGFALTETLVELGRQPDHDGIPEPGPVDIAALHRVGQKYGDEVVGPPLNPRR